jgi:hypothetical protein
MAVDERQPRGTRGDDGGRCDSAIDLVADKKQGRTRERRLWQVRGDGSGRREAMIWWWPQAVGGAGW